ncbi:site-2 protease family protein [Candidatus Kaiserbacteria bacterium]|nr:site-2 protease family protein [Candidatus Kaiserbacteria bacterium]
MSILIFIAVIVVLIVAHEFGHFIAAKMAGMRVDEFGLGYPPRALVIGKIGETEYTLNWLPFGGFVKIYGEDASLDKLGMPNSFSSKTRLAQALVLVAGVAMNLILAWIIFSGLLMTPHWVGNDVMTNGLPLVPALVKGAQVTVNATTAIATGLGHFFYGIFTFSADLSQVAGPVGIAQIVGDASLQGWSSLLSLTAIISINLALINLIPVPALDGGRLLFVIIESIIRRSIKPTIARAINGIGFAFLILLMLVVTAHDIFRIVG